jgi:3-methyladenine DNA glycosylase/8-oxoguanine DNA glycosylase
MEYGAHQTGLRAKLLQADALEGLNKCDESRKLVDEVLAIAEQIGATDLVSIAKQYVAGETIFNMKRQLANSIPNSHFDIVRNLSDNEINDMARDILEAFNLPADRIKYIVKDLFWDRDDANEITSYCRHMLTKQDITHTLKPDTLYAYDPPRIIECGLLGYRSPQSGTDRTFLINEFKRSFCHMCKRKEI